MPLYKEWESDKYSLAAIWKIEEPETFFLERTKLQTEIKNEKRRLEFLAGRFLLKHLKQDFPLLNIQKDLHDKPRIANNHYYFSISHSFPYVAAVVSPFVECGIDIQTWRPGMLQLQHKFLSEREQQLFRHDEKLITAAWCAKEAAYKWQGRRAAEFIRHLPVHKIFDLGENIDIIIKLELTANKLSVLCKCFIYNDFSLSLISSDTIEHPQF